jgi:hypothetical protein
LIRRDAAALAVVIAVVTLFFSDVLFFGRAFYFRDVTRFYYPLKKVTRDIILSGEFPSWNPYLSEGQPLAANPEFAVFYPPNWLLLLPDYELAFRLHILLHYYLAAIGMYVFLRSWRLRIESATFGAFAFAFGGLLLSLSCLLPYLLCLAWLPWLGFFVGRSSRRDAALAALCLALVLLGGEPVTIAQIILMSGVYALWTKCGAGNLAGVGAGIGGATQRLLMIFVAALLIASVQIVPGADHLFHSGSSRHGARRLSKLSNYSFRERSDPVRITRGCIGEPRSTTGSIRSSCRSIPDCSWHRSPWSHSFCDDRDGFRLLWR